MKCLYCGGEKTYVIASEQIGYSRQRRYRCVICGKRFNTRERIIRPKDWKGVNNEQG